jgi:hypothetical protein
MKTLDLKRELKHLYAPSAKKPEIVQVPRLQFAMIDGVSKKDTSPVIHQHLRKRRKLCIVFAIH